MYPKKIWERKGGGEDRMCRTGVYLKTGVKLLKI